MYVNIWLHLNSFPNFGKLNGSILTYKIMILNLCLTLNMFQICGWAVVFFFWFFFSSSKKGLSSTQRLMKSSDQAEPTGLLGRRWWELKQSFLYSEWKGCSSVRYEKNIFLWWKCIRSQRSKAIERAAWGNWVSRVSDSFESLLKTRC